MPSSPHPATPIQDFCCAQHELRRGVAHVSIAGELDITTVGELDVALRDAAAEADVVVADLRRLEFVDACGAELLLAAGRRMRRAGGRLVLAHGSAEVEWYFALIGAEDALEPLDRPSAATAALGAAW